MHLQKYLVPAMVAAAIHVSLAMYGPARSPVPRVPPPPEAPRPPSPPPDDSWIPLEPPEDRSMPAAPLGSSEAPPPDIIPVPNNSPITMTTPDVVTINPVKYDHLPDTLPSSPFDSGNRIGRPEIFRPGDLDQVPHALSQVAPAFPREMQNAGIGGTVTVEFMVDSTGRVVSAEAVSSTRRDFEDAAVHAVLRWRFEPGRRHGRAVPFRMAIPISFKATDA